MDGLVSRIKTTYFQKTLPQNNHHIHTDSLLNGRLKIHLQSLLACQKIIRLPVPGFVAVFLWKAMPQLFTEANFEMAFSDSG